jgi:hypothetical protein
LSGTRSKKDALLCALSLNRIRAEDYSALNEREATIWVNRRFVNNRSVDNTWTAELVVNRSIHYKR